MTSARKAAWLAVFYLSVACQPLPAPKPVEVFENPLPRWTNFFHGTFGKSPGPALVGDFNGDGTSDVATQIDTTIIVFHDTNATVPRNWEIIETQEPVRVEIQPASFAHERLPVLTGKLSDRQSVFILGESSPLVVFWYAAESAYAWQQVVPLALVPAKIDAERRLNISFGITRNSLFGSGKGFYGEPLLFEQFVGDFDGDGMEEFLAVETKEPNSSRFYLYEPGSIVPVIEEVPYRGTKAALHPDRGAQTIAVPQFDGHAKAESVTTRGAFVEIWNPEKSSVYVLLDKRWKMYRMSD
jgi:hypothetical protein